MLLFNNTPIPFGSFPNGESYFRTPWIDGHKDDINVVTLKYESDLDLYRLFTVKGYLDYKGIVATLRITYVPYSRMDRENDEYPFSLKFFARFINDMGWVGVTIYEPHSDVTPALFHRAKIVEVTRPLASVYTREGFDVFFPDAGAQKRYGTIPRSLVGFKQRDFKTGKITSLQIVGEPHTTSVVIMDDLCSKGGTFIMAAEKLREMGYKRIILVVAHCEDTMYEGQILKTDLIDLVVTTDSIWGMGPHEKMRIVPLTEFK